MVYNGDNITIYGYDIYIYIVSNNIIVIIITTTSVIIIILIYGCYLWLINV